MQYGVLPSIDRQLAGTGYPDYELRSGGADLTVGQDNVLEYVTAVEEAVLFEGAEAQVTAFRCVRLPLKAWHLSGRPVQ